LLPLTCCPPQYRSWEFINGGAKEQGGAVPGSIWLNSLTNGTSNGELLVLPAKYGPLTGVGIISAGYHTYTIDWQVGRRRAHLGG
jgi:hypothetical protein